MPEWLTAKNLVDAAGIAGFLLSLALAISQLWANRLRVSATDCVLVETNRAHDSIFIYTCLYNKTRQPFSLIDVCVVAGKERDEIPVKKNVITYSSKGSDSRAPVKSVVLSRAFPVRFDSYAAEALLLEVPRQRIDMKALHPDDPACSQEELPYTQSLQTHRPYKHRPQLRLMLRTSRGRSSIPVQIASVQGWEWLKKYAVQKAGHEEKILFP